MFYLERRSLTVISKDFTGCQNEEGQYNSPKVQNADLGTGECIRLNIRENVLNRKLRFMVESVTQLGSPFYHVGLNLDSCNEL